MLIEIKCSGCGKFNWDSQSGPYNEYHPSSDDEDLGQLVPCDMTGAVYLDGYRLEVDKLVTIIDPTSPFYLRGGYIKSIDREKGSVSVHISTERELFDILLAGIRLAQ